MKILIIYNLWSQNGEFMNKTLTVSLFVVLLFTSGNSVQAQTDCDPNFDPSCETNPDIPLDGKVGFLIGAATIYGFNRLKKLKTGAYRMDLVKVNQTLIRVHNQK